MCENRGSHDSPWLNVDSHLPLVSDELINLKWFRAQKVLFLIAEDAWLIFDDRFKNAQKKVLIFKFALKRLLDKISFPTISSTAIFDNKKQKSNLFSRAINQFLHFYSYRMSTHIYVLFCVSYILIDIKYPWFLKL